jgi:thiamine biosynthesis lipoprotein
MTMVHRTPAARLFTWARWLALAAGCLLAGGCRSLAEPAALERFEFAELHMGTSFQITLFASDGRTATNAARAAFRRVMELDRALTDYTEDSEIVRLFKAESGVPHRVSRDLFTVLDKARCVTELSDGSFDVTVGPLVQLWRRARRQRELPAAEAIASARQLVGADKIKLDPDGRTVTLAQTGMRLDVGGIAKGFAADAALAVLRERGISRAMVAASGDITVGDPPPGQSGWNIGIASIEAKPGEFTRVLVLQNAAVSTSGDTQQFVVLGGRRYSHIVNPATGLGLTHRTGVTVVAPNCTTTDALATAVSVMGAERGLALIERLPDVAALIVELDDAGGKRLVESKRFSNIRTQPVKNPNRSSP